LALFGRGAMSDLSPLWMAPALQEINWRSGIGRVQSSVRPVDAVGWDCWPWWSPRTRSHSAYQARYDAFDITWVVPVPGLTGPPSHRIALATS